MGFGNTKRIRCPACNSYRVEGTPKAFKCKKCGFKHIEKKPEPKLSIERLKNQLIKALEVAEETTTPTKEEAQAVRWVIEQTRAAIGTQRANKKQN